MSSLRPYQQQTVEAVESGWAEAKRQLVVLPTGAGKTVVASEIIRRQPGRTLFLAHREELIDQAIDKIRTFTGISAEKEKANHRASPDAEVVVASIQTMQSDRLKSWPRNHFTLVAIDEAHHALADTWRTAIDWFAESRLMGLTATPDRGDKKSLASIFDRVAHEVSLIDLVNDGYLSPIRVRHLPVEIDMSKARVRAGDIRTEDADAAIAPLMDALAASTAAQAWDRKLLVFLPLCEESDRFARLLSGHGIDARHIAGDSPDRAGILEWFSRPGPKALCNASLLLEGFDQPDVDAVLMLRPTKVRSLYAQAIGRGTRLAEGKDHLLILDPLWLTGRHGLVRPASLVARSREEAEAATAAMQEAGESDLLEGIETGCMELEARLAEEIAKQKRKAPRGTVDALAWSLAIHDSDLETYEPVMRWEEDPPTDKQIAALEKAGFWRESIRCKGHASAILDKLAARRALGLATPKQVLALKRTRHPNPDLETVQGASRWIGASFATAR